MCWTWFDISCSFDSQQSLGRCSISRAPELIGRSRYRWDLYHFPLGVQLICHLPACVCKFESILVWTLPCPRYQSSRIWLGSTHLPEDQETISSQVYMVYSRIGWWMSQKQHPSLTFICKWCRSINNGSLDQSSTIWKTLESLVEVESKVWIGATSFDPPTMLKIFLSLD